MNQIRERLRRYVQAMRYLLPGLVLAVVCEATFAVSLYTLVAGLLVIGLLIIPWVARWNRHLANLDRRRAGGLLGVDIPERQVRADKSWLDRAKRTLTDPMTYREGGWLLVRAVVGQVCGLVAIALTASVLFCLTLPLWWTFRQGRPFQVDAVTISSFTDAVIWSLPLAVINAAVALAAIPWAADIDARLTRRVLNTPARRLLQERVVELSDTRAAALDAHGAELRRIERDLHDGAQARLVSVAMRLGMAERTLADDPAKAAELLMDARAGAEDALSELRDIVRGMYPPILADRGLRGAVAALAARCAVPVSVSVDENTGRQPAAVEAAAYFVTAEALTNISKHSGATRAVVRVRKDGEVLMVEVTDDGHGGADESLGSGLDGIRRRAAALDGTMQLWSPLGGPTVLRLELPCGADRSQEE